MSLPTESFAILVLFLARLLSLGSAIPTFANADVCVWHDAIPELYHEYNDQDCPPIHSALDDGSCPVKEGDHDSCFGFAKSEPHFTSVKNSLTSVYPYWLHQTIPWQPSENSAFKELALMLGVTGGYSKNSGTTQNENLNIELKDGQCGYVTYVPIIQASCGTYTEATWPGVPHPCKDPRTTQNACVEQPKRVVHPDGYTDWETIRGVALFVYVHCSTFDPLPDKYQDPVFNLPNVRIPRDGDLISAYKDLWTRSIDGSPVFLADSPDCDHLPSINRTDCLEAVSNLLKHASDLIPVKEEKWHLLQGTRLEVFGHCSIWVAYNEAWNLDCNVSYMEAAAALQSVLDTCPKNGGRTVTGSQTLRDNGDCGSLVLFQTDKYKP